MKYILIALLTVTGPIMSKGQNKITGIIRDAKVHDPIEYATILLLDPQGHSTNTGTITNKDGAFSLEVSDNYTEGVKLRLSFIGYYTKPVYVTQQELKAGKPMYWELAVDTTQIPCAPVTPLKISKTTNHKSQEEGKREPLQYDYYLKDGDTIRWIPSDYRLFPPDKKTF